MASAAVRALAKVRTPRVTLEQLTGEVADRRRAGAYLHGVLPPLLARMAVSLEDGAPASLAGLPAFDELIAWYGASAVKISAVSPPPERATPAADPRSPWDRTSPRTRRRTPCPRPRAARLLDFRGGRSSSGR